MVTTLSMTKNQINHPNVVAIIVTYNRHKDLQRSINALFCQSVELFRVLVVDNASTDETEIVLNDTAEKYGDRFIAIRKSYNSGGAGGYKTGLEEALKLDADRFWLLDDDAEVEPTALEELIIVSINNTETYCSTALSVEDKQSLCWPPSNSLSIINQLDDIQKTNFAPFLGFYIHRTTIEKVGLPDARYFISGDDYEYSMRLKKHGMSVYWIKSSVLYHPKPQSILLSVFGYKYNHLTLPPWRRYYDIRNRIWNARKYNSIFMLLTVILSVITHLVISVASENHKAQQILAYTHGLIDGLKSITKIPTEKKRPTN